MCLHPSGASQSVSKFKLFHAQFGLPFDTSSARSIMGYRLLLHHPLLRSACQKDRGSATNARFERIPYSFSLPRAFLCTFLSSLSGVVCQFMKHADDRKSITLGTPAAAPIRGSRNATWVTQLANGLRCYFLDIPPARNPHTSPIGLRLPSYRQ